jgi:hypothetical protein
MEGFMTARTHVHAHHSHHHPHLMLPLRLYAVGHPFASEWATLAAITLAAILLWILNS